MTTAEKLEALVRKATDSGWKGEGDLVWSDFTHEKFSAARKEEQYGTIFSAQSVEWLLFNHPFARALFGEEEDDTEFVNGVFGEQPKLRMNYHLQQAVILPTPAEQVDYMYKVVFGESL